MVYAVASCDLPTVSSSSCSWRVIEALKVRNTFAVKPSICSWRYLLSTVVCEQEEREREREKERVCAWGGKGGADEPQNTQFAFVMMLPKIYHCMHVCSVMSSVQHQFCKKNKNKNARKPYRSTEFSNSL